MGFGGLGFGVRGSLGFINVHRGLSGSWVWGSVFGVRGLGFEVQGFRLQVLGFGFRVWCSGFEVWGSGFEVLGFGLWVPGLEFGVWGLGLGVSGFGFQVPSFEFRVRVLGFEFGVRRLGFGVSGFGFQVPSFEFRVRGLGFQVRVLGFEVWGSRLVDNRLDPRAPATTTHITSAAYIRDNNSTQHNVPDHVNTIGSAAKISCNSPEMGDQNNESILVQIIDNAQG
ncbi:hypothetical protein CQW23_24984 [Capsicum baccatum]|uniref:Uncharacterized protein n=1 Tax=Capsicum baccatum TaxID=33114 RepID=A0A2G2VWD4_CAPBA|nr:hypothetical protein CQW23_24984 [Capsicum baccatum]